MDIKKYPYNLIASILSTPENWVKFKNNCPNDFEKVIEYLFNFIDSRQKKVLLMYYRDKMTYVQIAEKLGVSGTRANQICIQAIREFRFRRGVELLLFGLQDETKEENIGYTYDLHLLSNTKLTNQQKNAIAGVRLETLMISSSIIKTLKNKNMDTVAEVVACGLGKNKMQLLRYLGKNRFIEVKNVIFKKYGIEI